MNYKVRNKNSNSLKLLKNSKVKNCFYTSEDLTKYYGKKENQNKSFNPSVEHLIAKSRIKNSKFNYNNVVNLVYAASQINELVGNAPLSVKFALK